MEKYLKISKQIGFSYVSMFIVVLLSPLLIYVLTRNLSIEEFGTYSLLAVAIEMVIIFFDLGISQFIMTKFPGMDDQDGVHQFFSLALFESILFFVIISALLLSNFHHLLLSLFGLSDYINEFAVVVFIIFFGILIRLYSAYFAAKQKLEFMSFINFMNKGFWIILVLIYMFFVKKIDLMDTFIIWLIGSFITLSVCLIVTIKIFFYFILHLFVNLKTIKKSLIFGVPLVFYHIGAYVIAMSDRYMISYFFNNTVVGLYSLAYSISLLILSLGVLISTVFYPYIAEAWNKKQDPNILLNASIKYGLVVMLPSIVGLFVLRKQIVTLISGVPYLQSAAVIPFLVLFPLFAFFSNIFYQLLLLRNKTKLIAAIYFASAILNIILNFALIPTYGMAGAAIATLISYIAMFIASFLPNKKVISFNFHFLRIGRIAIASLLMGICVFFINPAMFITKILTILFGVCIYFTFLFLMNVFIKSETDILVIFFSFKKWKK